MNILHLIDPGAVEVGAEALAMLADAVKRLPQYNHDVLIIGDAQWTGNARRIGLKPIGSISPVNQRPPLARRALRNVICRNERVHGNYNVIHAWSLSCAVLASYAAADHQIVAGPLATDPISCNLSRQAVKRINLTSPRILCATGDIKQKCTSLGIDPLLLGELSPGIDSDRIAQEKRALLRAGWHVDETAFAVGLLGDAQIAVTAATRVIHTSRNVRLIAHRDAHLRSQAMQWAMRLGNDDVMNIENDFSQLWNIAAGLDAAIVIAPQSQGKNHCAQSNNLISVLFLVAAGTPLIMDSAHQAGTLITEEETGLLVPGSDINAVANGILRLFDEPELAQRIRSTSKKYVADRFSANSMASNLADIYRQASRGQRVRVKALNKNIQPPETIKLNSYNARKTTAELVKGIC